MVGGTDALVTRAERTNFRETSLYEDVTAFAKALESDVCRLASIGRSHEGREMPLLVLSNHKLFDPDSARASGLPIVLILNDIHAGEVEGKEASLMLAREIVRGPLRSIADEMVLLILPLFNPDGNERISTRNRPLDLGKLDGQIGPDGGVGTRYTAAGLNLNRDYVKCEAVEMRNLNRNLFYSWRPHLTIDCHTTDGSIHGFELTYGTCMNPAAHPGPMEYVRTRLLPRVTDGLFRRTGIKTFFYGNFIDERDPSKGWRTYSAKPRYGSHYRGLANALDILSETYSYLPFGERVRVNREFLLEILRHVRPEVVELVRRAREDTAKGLPAEIPIQSQLESYAEPVEIVRRGFTVRMELDTEAPAPRIVYRDFAKSSKVETFKIPYVGRFVPAKTVRRPLGYLVPPDLREILSLHDIRFEPPPKVSLDLTRYRISKVHRAAAADYGDVAREEFAVEATAERVEGTSAAPGTWFVPTAQPQGNLIVYLLEPESDDGLSTWGFFEALLPGSSFPVWRVESPKG